MRWLIFSLLLWFWVTAVQAAPWQEVISLASQGVVVVVTQQVQAEDFYTPPLPSGVGSAIVLDPQGHLLAPAPLVRRARWIGVILPDGTQCGAQLVGIDYFSEVALLKIKPHPGLRPLRLASSLPRTGEEVVLLGRPRGGPAISFGRVLEAPVTISYQGLQVPDMIATSLALSPVGQGPVLNLRGEVVALAVDLPNLHFEGGIYAIPATRLRKACQLLKRRHEATWPWLGLEGDPLSPSLAKILRVPVSRGLLITKVFPGSPAARVGLRAGRRVISVGNLVYRVGDILVEINGQQVTTPYDLFRLLLNQKPGNLVQISYYRGSRKRSVKIRLSRRTFLHP